MTAKNQPTPAALREYLRTCEISRRRNAPGPAPELILRHGGFVGSAIQCHACLERTMNHARRHIADSEMKGVSVNSGTVILADTLIQSKGRFDRSWHAPAGGLWGCLIVADTFLTRARTLLPLTLGVSCCEAVREFGAGEAQVRWVNDVLVGGRKLAGFLVESLRSPCHGEAFHLLGFGININNNSFPAHLAASAVSLSLALDAPVVLHDFTLSFLAKMAWNIGLLCYEEERELKHSDFPENQEGHLLLDQWKTLSDSVGRRVRYGYDIQRRPLYEAVVTGINSDGAIIMQLDDGNETVEHSGELQYL
jgi:BirA family biotin operon repressor/biotin-[acetyl-CoA-carboxylase] ligase